MILHQFIVDYISKDSKVLDLGCGKGNLLYLLKKKCSFIQGIEKKEECIYDCLKKKVCVYHGDIKEGLSYQVDQSFDYVILNQTIQETAYLEYIIQEALRVGKVLILSFPNFAHWQIRFSLLFLGKSPGNKILKEQWYNTPNIRFLSLLDFMDFCRLKNYKILKKLFFSDSKKIKILPNLLAELALFVIEKNEK